MYIINFPDEFFKDAFNKEGLGINLLDYTKLL